MVVIGQEPGAKKLDKGMTKMYIFTDVSPIDVLQRFHIEFQRADNIVSGSLAFIGAV